MIVAMVTLLIMSVLTASAITLAVSTNAGAQQNVEQKDASEAAEAGLQAALYRYNTLLPSSGNCVGDTVTAPSSNGTCSSSVTAVGSGSTYQYYTTPAGSSAPCVGGTVASSSGTVGNICITSIGTSNGVSVRSEIHAAANLSGPLFQYPGITGLQGITEQNGSISINGAEATNGTITAGCCGSGLNVNSEPNYALDLGPSPGSYVQSTNGTFAAPNSTTHVSTIVLPPVNPGSSASTSANSGCTATPILATATCGISSNDNIFGYRPVAYTAATRSLSLANGASAYLAAGTYNFCSLTSTGGTITLASGVSAQNPVIIYIDSSTDAGSGCPASSAGLSLTGNDTTFANPTGDPTALQIYDYYQSNPIELSLQGGTTFLGTLYAPTSAVDLTNNGVTFDGAIAANLVTMGSSSFGGMNVTFNYESQVANIMGGTATGTYYRTAYGQCSATVSSATPTSGCS